MSIALHRVQYRPGERLGSRITECAVAWDIGANEAGRRLASLALHDLTISDYGEVSEFAERVPFVEACAYVSWRRLNP